MPHGIENVLEQKAHDIVQPLIDAPSYDAYRRAFTHAQQEAAALIQQTSGAPAAQGSNDELARLVASGNTAAFAWRCMRNRQPTPSRGPSRSGRAWLTHKAASACTRVKVAVLA